MKTGTSRSNRGTSWFALPASIRWRRVSSNVRELLRRGSSANPPTESARPVRPSQEPPAVAKGQPRCELVSRLRTAISSPPKASPRPPSSPLPPRSFFSCSSPRLPPRLRVSASDRSPLPIPEPYPPMYCARRGPASSGSAYPIRQNWSSANSTTESSDSPSASRCSFGHGVV